MITPNDSGIVYSEFVNATISKAGARFDRLTVPWTGNLDSPNTRISFASDASRIRLSVNYRATFSTPGAGLFRLEVDGQLTAAPIGSDTDVFINTYELATWAAPGARREYSLIMPYGSNVDFIDLRLSGGAPGLLSPPAANTANLYVAYGDSITHGFDSSSAAGGYPYRVGRLLGSRVINMGFFGRAVSAADGTAVGQLGADLITLAIGTNDYTYNTTAASFAANYDGMLDNLRALQPTVPVFALTPTWTSLEGVPNSLGMTRDDYRQLIRDVVFSRTPSDSQLYLIEGSVLVPPGLTYFPDGVHPSDAGFAFYASSLGGANLVADPGFEDNGFAWVDGGNSGVSTADPHGGANSLHIGPGGGGVTQTVGRVERGKSYQLSVWSKTEAPGEVASIGISFRDAAGVELAQVAFPVTWTSYQQHTLLVNSPTVYAYSEVFCSKAAGSSSLVLDDFLLTDAGGS